MAVSPAQEAGSDELITVRAGVVEALLGCLLFTTGQRHADLSALTYVYLAQYIDNKTGEQWSAGVTPDEFMALLNRLPESCRASYIPQAAEVGR